MGGGIIITIGMLVIYFGGLAYSVYKNPLPEATFEEYAVAGRSFGWPIVFMTIIGTWYPGSLFIGWAQMGHDMGVTVTYLIFYTTFGLFIFFIICSPLWKLGKRYGLKTMGHYFNVRYNSKVLRTVVGILVLCVEFPWVITELLASGYAIQAITYEAIPFNLGMLFLGVFSCLYIVFAGFRAEILADYYRGWLFLFGSLVVFLTIIIVEFGGLPDMLMEVRSLKAELLTLPGPVVDYWGGEAPGQLFWTSLIIMGGIGAYMWPSCFSRIYCAASTRELKKTLAYTPLVAPIIFMLILLVFIGVSARPEFSPDDTSFSLIDMISSFGPIPTAIISLLILSGALSMMDSMISSWIIVVTNDVITPWKPNISSRTQLMIARGLAVVITAVGLAIAMTELPSIVQILSRVYQGIVQVFPAVFLGLFWKGGNKYGAWASLIVGFAMVVIFAWTSPDYVPQLNGMQGGVLALGCGFVTYVVVSLLTRREPNVEELFETQRTPDEQLAHTPVQ